MRCLWLGADIPFPQYSGRRIYSAGLAEALSNAGVDVVALGVDLDGASTGTSSVEWRRVERGRAPAVLRRVASRWPSGAVERATGPYRHALHEALREGGWDVAVIDSMLLCWCLPVVRHAGLPVVYVSHNHETTLRGGYADRLSWREPTKVPLLIDARRIRRSERLLVTHSALVTAITRSDARRFSAGGARHVLVVTPGYSGTVVPERTIDDATPRVAVMVESMLWRVKRANVQRFVAAADPLLANAGVELRIVGITPPGFDEHAFGTLDAIRFTGRVDSVGDSLADARVGVISERDGGGFKLKALDYVFHRVPMVVLDGSIDDLPLTSGVDYAVADSEERVARKIAELIDDPAECQRLQTNAFHRCATQFDWSRRGSELAAALARVVANTAERVAER